MPTLVKIPPLELKVAGLLAICEQINKPKFDTYLPKGQLISKCPFGVFKSTKIQQNLP